MRARLLRISIFSQMVLGGALGWWLQSSWVAALLWALGLPVAVMLLTDTYTGIASRARGEPWSHWFQSLVGEYWGGILVFLLRQPWTVRPPMLLPATGHEKRIPVVLVHGYVCNHRIWDDVIATLRAQGHAVHAVNLEPLFTSIDRYAATIEATVQGLQGHSGVKQVALVGHSMGGLAIRAYLRAHGTTKTARVLTLGTPHRGTQVSQHVSSPNGRQMVWDSEWLQALAASETDAVRQLFRIALTPQDNIVFPQRAQVLQGVEPTVFPGIGHVQMCVDRNVIAWIAQQLKELDT